MSYWDRFAKGRVRRRRLLAGSGLGILGLGIVASVGCGSDGGGSGETKDATSLVTRLEDTTSKGKPGGVFPTFLPADVPHFDARTVVVGGTTNLAAQVYSRLFKFKPGILESFSNEVEGDVVEKWEFNADGTQLTLKLNPAAVWDQRAPTNGRKFDSSDVKTAWDLFAASHVSRGEFAYSSANPQAPIESVTTPDPQTVVMKLAFPLGTLLQNLALPTFYIYPKEAYNGGFDARTEARGSGAWQLTKWEPSAALTFAKAPAWHGKQQPFLDGVQMYIIPEQAQQVAQFRAHRLLSNAVLQEDVLPIKNSVPELVMYAQPISRLVTRPMFSFGNSGDSARALNDERVRQAIALAFDRDAMVDTFANVAQFEGAGLQVDKRLHTAIHAAEPEWIDPRGKEMGAGARFYNHDVAEAKKLMAAAGYANGVDITSNTIINAYPPQFFKRMEVILQMLAEIGVRAKRKERDYNSDYLPNIFYAKGDFDGFGMAMGTSFANAADFLYGWYHPDAARGSMKRGLYPQLEQDIAAARREIDNKKRTSLEQELQRKIATVQPMLGLFDAGAAVSFDLKWPEAENVGVYTGVSLPQEVYNYYWINEAKKKA